jgi:hypothetical protein
MFTRLHPIDEPIADISTHQAKLVEVKFRRTGFQDEISHIHASAMVNKVAESTTELAPYDEPLGPRPPNSAVAPSHRTRC